ncbi:hypothetical protein JKP88DRAFT_348122 [Tribonema minus]|uniref:Uncharacterized protein n=1 Tax=Tribonema minus TaxID=303371 RepID=A0A835Z204_9STRA|nr:hypothetical protein JKP88DRAFT_348122 [Tribonema minus]
MTNSKTCTLAAAVLALAASGEAFMTPTMTSKPPSNKVNIPTKSAAAAAAAAGLLLQGAVLFNQPAEAAMFEVSPSTSIERSVGFGMPNPSSDPTNNNAASGKTEGSKYTPQQQGGFAEKFSEGNVDYGSPKGTDFGETAGGIPGVASNTKETGGGAGAKFAQNTAEKEVARAKGGVEQIASKAGSAANAAKGGMKTGAAGAKEQPDLTARNGFSQGIKSRAESAGGAATNVANAVKEKAGGGQAGFDQVKRAGESVKDSIKDAVSSNINVAAAFDTPADAAKNALQNSGDAIRDTVNSGINTAQGAVSGSDVRGAASQAKSALQDGKNTVQSKVKTDISSTKNQFGQGNIGDQARGAGNAVQNKVGSDIASTKGAIDGNPIEQAKSALSNAGDAVKNKVGSDVATAQGAVGSNGGASTSLNTARDVGNAIKDKVGSGLDAVTDGSAQNLAYNTVRDAASNNPAFNPNAAKNAGDAIKRGVSEVTNSVPGGNAGDAIKSKVGSDINSAKGAFNNNNVASNAQDAGDALKSKVGSDINSAKSAFNNNNNLASNAQDAGDAIKSKVGSDINSAKGAANQAKGAFNNNNVAQDAKGAANKAKGWFNRGVGSNSNVASNAKDAGNAIKSKVSSDVNTAKGGANQAKGVLNNNNVAQDAKGAANKAKGLFNQGAFNSDSNVAQDAGNAIKSKVSGDINTAKNTLDSRNNLAMNAERAGDAIKSKVSSDVNTAKDAVSNSGRTTQGIFGRQNKWQYGKQSQAIDAASQAGDVTKNLVGN